MLKFYEILKLEATEHHHHTVKKFLSNAVELHSHNDLINY